MSDASPKENTNHSISLYFSIYHLVLSAGIMGALSNVIFETFSTSHNLSQTYPALAIFAALFIVTLCHHFLRNSNDSSFNNSASSTNSLTSLLLPLIYSLLIGLSIAELQYSVLPSLTIIALWYLYSFTSGGIKVWGIANLGMILGGITGLFLLNHQQITESSNLWVTLSVGISAVICLMIYGFVFHRLSSSAQANVAKLEDELKTHKLREYEMSLHLPKPIKLQIEGRKKAKIERKPITIFFSDIVGFTSLSEELEAETLSEILSSYLSEMSKVVAQYGGTIDKFIGDAIMVTFGDDKSLSKGIKKDAVSCVAMAIAMGKRMRELQASWAEMGIKKPLQIRIGINSGYCTVGTFGISQHLDHTALGVHVNLASRLESAAQPNEILVTHETWNLIKDNIMCKDKGTIKAKGFTHPIQVFQVINHRKELGGNQSYFSETADGFSMHLDMQKVKEYDREKVIHSLKLAAKRLQDKHLKK